MEINKTPILLTIRKLKKPILLTKDKLKNIERQLSDDDFNETVLQGLFVLSISFFEIMLSDTLKYYLINFPQKLDKSELNFSKDDVLSHFTNTKLLALQIDKKINSMFYERLDEVLKYFLKSLSINEKPINQNHIDKIIEIKETRNLLLHNNLIVNSSYIEKAGKLKRANRVDDKLKITKDYLNDSLINITEIISEIESRIDFKYSKYTKIKALKELWNFMFSSPIMPFDDFWTVSEQSDGIIVAKKSPLESQISNSERMFLGMWRTHFNQNTEYLNNFSMYSLDTTHQEKILYFLSIVDDIRLE